MSDIDFVEFKPETRKWMFWLARIFGVKRVGQDGNTKVVMYYWRGRYWVSE